MALTQAAPRQRSLSTSPVFPYYNPNSTSRRQDNLRNDQFALHAPESIDAHDSFPRGRKQTAAATVWQAGTNETGTA